MGLESSKATDLEVKNREMPLQTRHFPHTANNNWGSEGSLTFPSFCWKAELVLRVQCSMLPFHWRKKRECWRVINKAVYWRMGLHSMPLGWKVLGTMKALWFSFLRSSFNRLEPWKSSYTNYWFLMKTWILPLVSFTSATCVDLYSQAGTVEL